MTSPVLRPEEPSDDAFLFALFAEEAVPTLRRAGLAEAQALDLARMQHRARSASYRDGFPGARFSVATLDGVPVGRRVAARGADRLHLVDLAIARDWRRRGLAAALLDGLIAEAREAGLALTLSVETTNLPALRLYCSRGFTVAAEAPPYLQMRLEPRPAPGAGAHGPGRPLETRASLFPDRLRLPLAFDPAPLRAELADIEGAGWIAHFVPRHYDGDWSAIPLRGKAGATHPIMMIVSEPGADYADAPWLASCPAFAGVLAAFACPLQAVRLMRLGPGSVIKEHRDHDLSFEDGFVRIHVPVATNAQVDFRLNGTPVAMEPGSAWYLRLSDPHAVANRGASPRIHLVIDAVVNDWVGDLFARAAAAETAA